MMVLSCRPCHALVVSKKNLLLKRCSKVHVKIVTSKMHSYRRGRPHNCIGSVVNNFHVTAASLFTCSAANKRTDICDGTNSYTQKTRRSAITSQRRFFSSATNEKREQGLDNSYPPPSEPSDDKNNGKENESMNGNSTKKLPESSSFKSKGSRQEISNSDVQIQETKKLRVSDVPISEVLKKKHALRWVDPVIDQDSTVLEAISTTIDGGLSGMMVREKDTNRVVGLLTSRDLLRIMRMGVKNGEDSDAIMNRVVGNYMTPISQVVYGRPDETIGMCRTIMAKLGIKCLPILKDDSKVEGLITAKDMSEFSLTAKDKGGKKNFLDDVSERVGLRSNNTSMADPPPFLQAHLALKQSPLFINVGIAELPHPFKTEQGVSMSQREFRSSNYSTDPKLSEDAHFQTTVNLPSTNSISNKSADRTKDGEISDAEVTFLGVGDGVGSWREYGVDPRKFSRKLMKECENVILDSTTRSKNETAPSTCTWLKELLSPSEVLERAFQRVCEADIVGSSTACIAMFDNTRHQLHFSNLGDSGIILLRHIDSDVAGSLKRNRIVPRAERKSDLRVAFVSQQQLHSFNHPFQLGWTGQDLQEEGNDDDHNDNSFKCAKDACVTSVHARRGDIIIIATDGLFDNIDIDDIANIALEWEQENGFMEGRDIGERERRWMMGHSCVGLSKEKIQDLANTLVNRARVNSLDKTVDSPFATLAKENDIMWNGGMPDDCTVIALHVVGRNASTTNV